MNPKISNITNRWVDILLPFTGNYGMRFSATELAKLSGIPQQTASRQLNELTKENMLNYEIRGRNKLFYLDHSKQSTKNVFEVLENQKSLIFQRKLTKVSVIISELIGYTEAIIVFGSYSSYKFTKDSDLDLLFLGKSDKAYIDKIRQRNTIEINSHYMLYSGFSKLLAEKNPLAVEILKNHTIFGDISKIVSIFLEVTK